MGVPDKNVLQARCARKRPSKKAYGQEASKTSHRRHLVTCRRRPGRMKTRNDAGLSEADALRHVSQQSAIHGTRLSRMTPIL